MRRGEVWWAESPALVRRTPVLLLTRDSAYQVRTAVTVAPITSRIRGIPVEVRVGVDEGLPRESVVNLDDITTIRKASLQGRVGELSAEKIRAVESAIKLALALA